MELAKGGSFFPGELECQEGTRGALAVTALLQPVAQVSLFGAILLMHW